MDPPREGVRQALDEQVQKEGLAATHPAPEIQAAQRRSSRGRPEWAKEAREKRAAAALRRLDQPPPQLIEPLDHGELRGILLERALIELRAVALEHGRS